MNKALRSWNPAVESSFLHVPDGSDVFLPEVHGARRGAILYVHEDEVVMGKQSGSRDAQRKRPG